MERDGEMERWRERERERERRQSSVAIVIYGLMSTMSSYSTPCLVLRL